MSELFCLPSEKGYNVYFDRAFELSGREFVCRKVNWKSPSYPPCKEWQKMYLYVQFPWLLRDYQY